MFDNYRRPRRRWGLWILALAAGGAALAYQGLLPEALTRLPGEALSRLPEPVLALLPGARRVEGVASMLPRDTMLLITARSDAGLSAALPAVEQVLGPAMGAPEGLRLSELDRWAAASLESADPSEAVQVLFVPLEEAGALAGAQGAGGGWETMAHRGWLVAARSSREDVDAAQVLAAIRERPADRSLAADQDFQEATGAVSGGQLRVFGQRRALHQLLTEGGAPGLLQAALDRTGLRSWCLAVELNQEALVGRLATSGNSSRLSRMQDRSVQADDFAAGIPGEAAVAIRWSADVVRFREDLAPFPLLRLAEWAAGRHLRRQHGLLLQEDLLEHMAGDGGIVWLKRGEEADGYARARVIDPMETEWVSTSSDKTRSVGWARLREVAPVRAALDRTPDASPGRAPVSRGAGRWYPGREGAVGLVGEHLVVLADLDDADAVGVAGPGFLETIPPRARQQLASGPPIYIWYDIAPHLDPVESLNPADAALNAAYAPLDYAELATDVVGGAIVREVGLYTDGRPAPEVFAEIARAGALQRPHSALIRDVEDLERELRRTRHQASITCGGEAAAAAGAAGRMSWEEECWRRLGRSEEARLYAGALWVAVEGGREVVYGVVDADGDGAPARYRMAVGEAEVTRSTGAEVF